MADRARASPGRANPGRARAVKANRLTSRPLHRAIAALLRSRHLPPVRASSGRANPQGSDGHRKCRSPEEVRMTQRIEYATAAPEALRPLYQATRYLHTSTTLETSLLNLVFLRASQMNACAFCIAMHWREGRESGLSDDQMHGLLAWREASWYSERERAALAWTEAITDIAHSQAPDDVYAEV